LTTGEKDAAAVRVFPPAIPLLIILLGVGMSRIWPIHLPFEVAPLARYGAGGLIVVAAILSLGLRSVLLLRRSGQSENPWKPTLSIVERGPFRISRNPMYLQLILICIGVAIILGNVWVLALTPLCAWLLQRLAIRPEEAYLERKFGEVYLEYKRRVRRWL
jgi:protein-S-isoprenylcysteine O-methyltransferase Ste14